MFEEQSPESELISMEKSICNPNFFIPMPVVLVGTIVNGKANFMPAGWFRG